MRAQAAVEIRLQGADLGRRANVLRIEPPVRGRPGVGLGEDGGRVGEYAIAADEDRSGLAPAGTADGDPVEQLEMGTLLVGDPGARSSAQRAFSHKWLIGIVMRKQLRSILRFYTAPAGAVKQVGPEDLSSPCVVRFNNEGLDHVAISVSDVARSRAFYENVLGLERAREEWDVPVVMNAGGSGLALFPRESHPASGPEGAEPEIRILHIAFRVDREGFDEARDALAADGVEARFSDHDISHSLYFNDPDGHQIELTTYEGLTLYAPSMCRNIRTLHNFDPPATEEEVHDAALQYVRKISGSSKPSRANAEAFELAVEEVAEATGRLLDALVTSAPPKDREVEAEKRRARSAARFAAA
jgi:catechol 2,3-dioxygenase-like lactoylglutathione lyase family enzyme